MSRRRLSGRRGGALMASALLHTAVLALLAHFLAQTPQYAEPPAMKVILAAPLPAKRPPPDRPDRRREAASRTPAAAARPIPHEPSAVAPRIAADRGDGLAGRGQQVLRRLAGCERPNLTREEREACERRRWGRDQPALARLNLDPTGRYAENPEPFLSRRPEKGCRVRATGDIDAMGDSGNARAGVTCVIPF